MSIEIKEREEIELEPGEVRILAEPLYKSRNQEETEILIEYIEERKHLQLKFVDMRGLADRIRKVLHSPATGANGNTARVAICKTMFDYGLTVDQAIYVCMKTKHWQDLEEKTPYYIAKAYERWLKGKGKGNCQGNGNRNGRGEKRSEAEVFSPSPLSSQEIENLIANVKWRSLPGIDKMSVKSKIEVIQEYFINRDDVFKTQRAPDKFRDKWGYNDINRKMEGKDIWRHLDTAINPDKKQYTIGIYDHSVDAKGKWICFDFDDDEDDKNGSNLRNAYRIIGYFESRGISPMLENASEGIKSYHVWVFCESANIGALNAIGEAALEATGIKCELKPNGNEECEFGGVMRLPFGLNRKRNAKSISMTYDKGVACALFNTKPL